MESGDAGLTHVVVDVIAPSKVAAWRAVFDHETDMPVIGAPIPVGMHWTLCLPFYRQSLLAEDGSMPDPAVLPHGARQRRMWAGCRSTFHGPLLVGDRVERRSSVIRIVEKHGRGGPLRFVTLRHQIIGSQGLAVDEEQDFVFSTATAGTSRHADARIECRDKRQPVCERSIHVDSVLLFRYSALTGNAHRIHYDFEYATSVEGYDGRVVQGPLLASLMLEVLRNVRPNAVVESFRIKVRRPTCDTAPIRLFAASSENATRFHFWSMNHEGVEATEAEAHIR